MRRAGRIRSKRILDERGTRPAGRGAHHTRRAPHWHRSHRPGTMRAPSGRRPVPEEPEIETENLREAVHEELERDGGSLLRNIALTTALLAAFAAVAALEAGATVNEALVLKTEATRLQAQASDQWSY